MLIMANDLNDAIEVGIDPVKLLESKDSCNKR
jgi:hypothetical protein